MSEARDRILIVDDDPDYAEVLTRGLSGRFETESAASLAEARDLLSRTVFHGVLLDVRLRGAGSDDRDGLELLAELKKDRPLTPVLVMTGYGDIEMAVQALNLGANDFVDKDAVRPKELIGRLRDQIDEGRRSLRIEARASELERLAASNMVGSSDAMGPVHEAIRMAAGDSKVSVLILGETGTGKEVVARTIHEEGQMSDGPFVAVPTPALTASLIESELFGHEKGAFTGAASARTGYIERASGGVLFLDEIGDLPVEQQVKLLQFLESRIVVRVGSSQPRPVDVQIIAATNQDLKKRCEEGAFRRDLYYRLRTIEIRVPPLRNRMDDVPLLADHFLHLLRRQGRTKLTGFSPQAIETLQSHAWPGNVRELKAAVEWAALSAMRKGHWAIEGEDLPQELVEPEGAELSADGSDFNVARATAVAELECVERALIKANGLKSDAEKLLGYSGRHTMNRRIKNALLMVEERQSRFPVTSKAYPVDDRAAGVDRR